MSPRWSWDFEEDKRPAAEPRSPATPLPRPLAGKQRSPRAHVRRRRALAATGVVLVLALLVVALAGSSSHSATRSPSVHGPAPAAHSAPLPTPAQAQAAESNAVRSVLAYTPFVTGGGGSGRDIALTFDDGPGPYTPEVLSVLERFHVPATFFVIGKMLRYFSASTARAVHDGDVIGDHTETHPMLATLSAHDQREELFEQIARVELLDTPRPLLFRPPYGSFNPNTLRELRALHLLMVLWSVDTEDYRQPGVPVIVERALAGARAGAIILMHDAGGTRTQTIAALPLIITALRARGFHLVTVPQLLKDDPPAAGQPLPPNLSGG